MHHRPLAGRGRTRVGLVTRAAVTLRGGRARGLLVLLLAATLAGGCVSRNVERISDEEAATIPPPPEPRAQGQRSAAADTAATRVTGVVEIDAGVADNAPANATLYLILRVAGREGGAPLAVQQIRNPTLPFSFEMTERDAMIPGTPLVGEMSLTVRLDQDGDAFTTSPGDLRGQVSPVVAGDSGIVVRLDELVEGP